MYFVALEGVSRYALSEAVKAVMRGALDHTFFPTPVELRRQCDAAMKPHHDQARRAAIMEEMHRDRRQWDRANAAKTPDAKARVAEAYARFCDGYERQKETETLRLDPALVAQVPDNPKALNRQKMGRDAA